jgi:trans-aconitate methyltransferase
MSTKAHWEAIYKDKSPLEVSWRQERPTLSLALIAKYLGQKDEPIIDVGGGASTLVDYLLHAGYENITVLDLSANALEYAKQRLGEKAAAVHWQEADVTHFVSAQKFALWHDRAVFHFLTQSQDREKYQQTLLSSIQPGGIAIIAAFAPGGPTQCSGLDIVQYDGDKLQAVLGEAFQLLAEEHETHITPAGKEQAFGYHVFVRRS